MSTLNSPTARSIIYLSCVGGLLIVNSFVVTFFWNDVVDGVMHSGHHLTFLEGTGLSAFAYVVVFSVRYGCTTRAKSASPSTRGQQSSVQNKCSAMTAEQKAALKAELRERCGCQDEAVQTPADTLHASP